MKITIKGSPKELAGLAKVFIGAENGVKKVELPPLLTELVEGGKSNTFTKAMRSALEKINENAKQRKENAPQVEAAEHQENQVLSREEAKAIVKSVDAAAKEALKFLYHTP